MLECCTKISENLKEKGYSSKVINVRTIKPFDYSLISNSVGAARLAITVEDNEINGGAGQYIASNLPRYLRQKIVNFGYDDCFVCQGSQSELFERYELNAKDITTKILKELNKDEQQN